MDAADGPMSMSARYAGPPVDSRGLVVKRGLDVGSAESLVALSAEWAFFTPAVLYTRGEFTDAFLIDFMFDLGEDVGLYYRKFRHPIFRGLNTASGDVAWNHALWAVRPEFWPPLVDFVCSLSVASREAGRMWRFGLQEFDVCDPLALERSAVLSAAVPSLRVGAFGLYGNASMAYFSPGSNPFVPPSLGFHPPREADKVFAGAYFAGDNPFDAREAFLRGKERS